MVHFYYGSKDAVTTPQFSNCPSLDLIWEKGQDKDSNGHTICHI